MLKLFIVGAAFIGACGYAAEVAMEAREVQLARIICDKIVRSTELEKLSREVILDRVLDRKSWDELSIAGKERLAASAYASFVDGLESKDVEHDVKQTLGWYAKASLDGDLYAFFRLGILLANWEKRNEEGDILIQAASDLGEHHAKVYLGIVPEE